MLDVLTIIGALSCAAIAAVLPRKSRARHGAAEFPGNLKRVSFRFHARILPDTIIHEHNKITTTTQGRSQVDAGIMSQRVLWVHIQV